RLFALLRGYPTPRGSHTPRRGGTGGAQRQAGGDAVEEVAGPDRAELAGAEAPGHRQRAEQLVDEAGVVVGLAEEPLPPPVAGEEQGGVGFGRGEEVAQVLVGRAGVADLELHRPPDGDHVADGDGAAALV